MSWEEAQDLNISPTRWAGLARDYPFAAYMNPMRDLFALEDPNFGWALLEEKHREHWLKIGFDLMAGASYAPIKRLLLAACKEYLMPAENETIQLLLAQAKKGMSTDEFRLKVEERYQRKHAAEGNPVLKVYWDYARQALWCAHYLEASKRRPWAELCRSIARSAFRNLHGMPGLRAFNQKALWDAVLVEALLYMEKTR